MSHMFIRLNYLKPSSGKRHIYVYVCIYIKVKVIPQQAEVAQGFPGSLRPRIFLTFGTTKVVGSHMHRRNPWYSFSEAQSTPGHMVQSGATEKNPH